MELMQHPDAAATGGNWCRGNILCHVGCTTWAPTALSKWPITQRPTGEAGPVLPVSNYVDLLNIFAFWIHCGLAQTRSHGRTTIKAFSL